jgi:hypothetical protein
VAQFLSDDSPAKLTAFYQKELSKYGPVIECHTSHNLGHTDYKKNMDSKDDQLHCEQDSGDTLELKVGTENYQHVVAIKPRGDGSEFALVYVNAHGKEEPI